jgi:hypothetical protein
MAQNRPIPIGKQNIWHRKVIALAKSIPNSRKRSLSHQIKRAVSNEVPTMKTRYAAENLKPVISKAARMRKGNLRNNRPPRKRRLICKCFLPEVKGPEIVLSVFRIYPVQEIQLGPDW